MHVIQIKSKQFYAENIRTKNCQHNKNGNGDITTPIRWNFWHYGQKYIYKWIYSRGYTLLVSTQTHMIKICSTLHWSETISMGSKGYAHYVFIGFASPSSIQYMRCEWIWFKIIFARINSVCVIIQHEDVYTYSFRFGYYFDQREIELSVHLFICICVCVCEEIFYNFLLTLLSLFFFSL